MIDIKKLRDEFDATAAELGRRGVEIEKLQKARDLDAKRRALIGETESLKQQRNSASKEIGAAAKAGQDVSAAKEKMRAIGAAFGFDSTDKFCSYTFGAKGAFAPMGFLGSYTAD